MKIAEIVNDITKNVVFDKYDLNIDYLSTAYGILIHYNDVTSLYMKKRNKDIISIKKDTKINMWKSFTHELGHMFLHYTNQRCSHPMFNEKQEAEAETFSLLMRMPERIIVDNKLWTVDQVIQYFKVSYEDAYLRMELLANRTKTNRLVGINSYSN